MSIHINFNNRNVLGIAELVTADQNDWQATKKTQALDLFQTAKLPSRKVEHWKYNDMTFLGKGSFSIAQPPSLETRANALEHISRIELSHAVELIIIDGYLATALTELPDIQGLKITTFDTADEQQQQTILSQIDPEFSAKNLLINLSSAINSNGILIEVAANCHLSNPIYLRHITSPGKAATLTSHATIVSLASSSNAQIVEQFDAPQQQETRLALAQTIINLSANSQLTHYRLNLEDESARQVSQVKTTLGKDAVVNSFYLGLGSQLNRTDIDMIHQGQNAECNMTGIYLPANNQTIDYHTNIEHRVSHCNTNETFRGIIADSASATFNGKIHIFQDAQKSDAQLNNKNLLLTNRAEINTKPELEIYADDVSCAHGATVAQLDDKSIYYLQARGINKQKAQKMLSIAFVQELLNKIRNESIREFLCQLLDKHMSRIDE